MIEVYVSEEGGMRINIEPEVWQSRTGWLARVGSLNLCASGTSPTEAVEELALGIKAWFRSIENNNILVESLEMAGLAYEESDGPLVVVWPEIALTEL